MGWAQAVALLSLCVSSLSALHQCSWLCVLCIVVDDEYDSSFMQLPWHVQARAPLSLEPQA